MSITEVYHVGQITLPYCLISKMEAYAVPGEVVQSVKRKRLTYESATYEKAVTLARHHGSLVASAKLNAGKPEAEHISESTVRTWLSRWKKEGQFWEVEKKRGRRNTLQQVAGAPEEWSKQIDSLRAQGQSVTARVSAVVARAVVEQKAPSLLQRHGGSTKFSVNTGSRLLAAAGKSYRKRTSTRIIPPDDEVVSARDKFYSNITDSFPEGPPDPSLVLNFDQTFHLYSPNRGYTWEKRGSDRVQLTSSRDGFTLVPVVASTAMVGAQIIFGGTTEAVLPRVAPGPLLKYEYNATHWSNEKTTLALWKEILIPYIRQRRTDLGDPDATALVLADAFSAHWCPSVTALVASVQGVVYIAIPEALTHLFQPLDLGIIASLKHSIQRRKDDFMEKEVATSIKEGRAVVLSKSRPVLREKITLWIKEAVTDPVICAAHCCQTGFARAGITRLLYGHAQVEPDVDRVVAPAVCADCGELGRKCDDLPDCEHFAELDTATLCNGCLTNHRELCVSL